jgi:tRNA1(Val) A37 N6-methylase TrmN6
MNIIQGDIHEVIKTLETNSIDFIYNNPPFATTANHTSKHSANKLSNINPSPSKKRTPLKGR